MKRLADGQCVHVPQDTVAIHWMYAVDPNVLIIQNVRVICHVEMVIALIHVQALVVLVLIAKYVKNKRKYEKHRINSNKTVFRCEIMCLFAVVREAFAVIHFHIAFELIQVCISRQNIVYLIILKVHTTSLNKRKKRKQLFNVFQLSNSYLFTFF